MRIILTGARGQLGMSLRKALVAENLSALSHQDLDIRDAAQVRNMTRRLRPDVVINTAAIRKPDECEKEPERAFATNALGTRNLALACAEIGSTLLQVSTDSVFDGCKTSPYLEDDDPNPINVYGVSKLAGEFFVRNTLEKYYIVRSTGFFGGANSSGRAGNFVLTMLRQASEGKESRVVTDQYVSPTYTMDLARKIAWLIKTEVYGVYHVTNSGACSWYEFAQAIFEKAEVDADLIPTTTKILELPSRRLRYAVLGHGRLQNLEADDLPPWQDALERYLDELCRGGRE